MKKLEAKELTATNAGTKRPLSRFARRLLQACARLALPSDGRIVVAVSGGADSTALLLAFDELNKAGRMMLRLKVAHLDHELRGEAGARDARFVAELAATLGYESAIGSAAVGQRAARTRDNLEQAARRERYQFLGDVARAWEARAIAVAHTLEDQAETLLLALLRGSGARGLGAMSDSRPFDERGDELRLVRPLLGWARRAETVEYCAARGVSVRSDAMNDDERFARVRVRRQLLPLLETFNPRAVETLARTARLLRAEASALEHLGGQLLAAASRDASAKAEAKRVEERGARGRLAACDRVVADEGDGVADESDAVADEGGAVRSDAVVGEGGAVAVGGDAVAVGSDDVANERDAVAGERGALEVSPALSVEVLRGADEAVLGYALRDWIKSQRGDLRRIEATHIEAVARLLDGARGGRVAELPGGASVERRRGLLLFRAGGGGAGKS